MFRFLKAAGFDETIDVDRDKIGTRKCTLITDLAHIDEPERWKNLSVLIRMESERCIKATGRTEKSIRYYIASKAADAAFYQKNIKGHWGHRKQAVLDS